MEVNKPNLMKAEVQLKLAALGSRIEDIPKRLDQSVRKVPWPQPSALLKTKTTPWYFQRLPTAEQGPKT